MTHTACGKVILLGEHAVVFGRPALAAGLARGAEAEFFPAERGGELAIEITPWNVRVVHGDATELARGLDALVSALPGNSQGLAGIVRATMHLPGGGGLGSSAALGVAVARALGEHTAERPLTLDEVLASALAWERVFHGNPSGVDHTMAARGGAAVYSRNEGFHPVDLRATFRLLIGDSGERARTRDMVASVARIHERKPVATDRVFDAIAAIVRNGALALAANDMRALGQLMDMNQALLSSLLLSTERLESLCMAARASGALGAKLTGGGGGGCVIALPGENEDHVRAAWENLGAQVFAAEIGSSAEQS